MTVDPSVVPAARNARRPPHRGARIYSLPAPADHAIENLRVTFWGVQGSCPIFPSPQGLAEYSRQLAVQMLERTFTDLAARARNGKINIEALLGGPPTRANVANYQKQIGLPEVPTYGGETTCVQVETSEGNVIILDAGTGLRRCSLKLVEQWADKPDRTIHLFGSHEHLDHRCGLTFSRFCFIDENRFTIHVYGSYPFLHALDSHYGVFSRRLSDSTHVDDPMDFRAMPALFKGVELRRPNEDHGRRRKGLGLSYIDQPIRIGSTTITPFEVYHVIPICLGYKIQHNNRTFVFCTDHELRRGPYLDEARQIRSADAEARVLRYCQDADLAYFDGQYTLDEYQGKRGIGSFPPTARVDWGHSTIEDAVDRAIACRIKHTLIGHHDPERSWRDRNDLAKKVAHLSRKNRKIQLADGDCVVDL